MRKVRCLTLALLPVLPISLSSIAWADSPYSPHRDETYPTGMGFVTTSLANAAEPWPAAWPLQMERVVVFHGYEDGADPFPLAEVLRGAGVDVVEYYPSPQPDYDTRAALRTLIHHNLDAGGVLFLLDAKDALADADWQGFSSFLLAFELVPRQIALVPVSSANATLSMWFEEYLGP